MKKPSQAAAASPLRSRYALDLFASISIFSLIVLKNKFAEKRLSYGAVSKVALDSPIAPHQQIASLLQRPPVSRLTIQREFRKEESFADDNSFQHSY